MLLFEYADDGVIRTKTKILSPYLQTGVDVVVSKRATPLSEDVGEMVLGNQLLDGGSLLLSRSDYEGVSADGRNFVKRIFGGREFIRGEVRYG